MKSLTLLLVVAVATICAFSALTSGAALTNDQGETQLHFGFKQDNGYQRVEDIKYNKTSTESVTVEKPDEKPVEIRGGYSYISADGYEYTVKYKANKNGFQPYVTAHKLKDSA